MYYPHFYKTVLFSCLTFVFSLIAKAENFQKLSDHPSVRIYHNFITEEEAKHLISLGASKLKRSAVVSEEGLAQISAERTSSSASLGKSQDTIVQSIEEKVAQILGCSIDCIEPLQIVHYTHGQEYAPHYDYFDAKYLATHHNNQRKDTFLIYLNTLDLQDGGFTVFPELQFAVLPIVGNALYFKNLDSNEQEDPKTLHGGMPIQKEGVEKWACNVWIRQKPLQ